MTIRFEIGGRPVGVHNLKSVLEHALCEQLAAQLRERLQGIRDPDTGAFPVLVVRGDSFDSLSLSVEGSPALVALVKERLGGQVEEEPMTSSPGTPPTAFISHASEDKPLARRLAIDLEARGVKVFFDEWDIGLGESIRQRIDEGLLGAEYVLIIFSPRSIAKPWVKAETDAAFMRKLAGEAKLIPLRAELAPKDLPPLLQTLRSPDLSDYDQALDEISGTLHGLARRPPRGPPPAAIQAHPVGVEGLSPAAAQIAKLCSDQSDSGGHGERQIEAQELRTATGLHDNEIIDAVDELHARGLIWTNKHMNMDRIGFASIRAEPALFSALDRYFTEHDPEKDALRISADMVNEIESGSVPEMASRYGWEPRRMNPALTYLIERGAVEFSRSSNPTYVSMWLHATPKTRRLLAARS